jgi:hypothetical protein
MRELNTRTADDEALQEHSRAVARGKREPADPVPVVEPYRVDIALWWDAYANVLGRGIGRWSDRLDVESPSMRKARWDIGCWADVANSDQPASVIAPEYNITPAYARALRRGVWRRPLWTQV